MAKKAVSTGAKKAAVPAKKSAPAKKVAAKKEVPVKEVAVAKVTEKRQAKKEKTDSKKATPASKATKKSETPKKSEAPKKADAPKMSEAPKKESTEPSKQEINEVAEKEASKNVEEKQRAKKPRKKVFPKKFNDTAIEKKNKKSIEQQLAKLKGSEWDSDDDMGVPASNEADEPEINFEANVDFVELTKKTKKNLSKAKETAASTVAAAAQKSAQSSTIFIGRIPHGFYEKQMHGFFSQFGGIKRLKLSRNKKSGKSKHYAFIEFEETEVARVVADTMDGYRLFNKTIACNIVPSEKCHERMFIGANRTFRPIPYRKLAIRAHNAPKTFEQREVSNSRLVSREETKRNKLKALGIDYEFDGFAGAAPLKSTHVQF